MLCQLSVNFRDRGVGTFVGALALVTTIQMIVTG
jgi:hypothetical protein